MKCPKCGTENRFNAIICDSCGASLLETPADEPLDLNRFAPAHSDPVSSPERGHGAPAPSSERKHSVPDVSQFESSEETSENENSFADKAGETLRNICKKTGEAFTAAYEWIADKVRKLISKFDDGDGVLEDDEKFRKIVLAVILGIAAVVIVIFVGFSCSCNSCAPATLAGTWVEAGCVNDGYQSSDLILELAPNGQLIDRGTPAGAYNFSEGMLTFTINGMEYSGLTEARADEMTVSLHGYSSVSLNLVKLSDETGLTAQELAALYPDD